MIEVDFNGFNEEHDLFALKEYIEDNRVNILTQLKEQLANVLNFIFYCEMATICEKVDFINERTNEVDYMLISKTYHTINMQDFFDNFNQSLNDCIDKMQDEGIKQSGLSFREIKNIKFIVTKLLTNESNPMNHDSDNLIF